MLQHVVAFLIGAAGGYLIKPFWLAVVVVITTVTIGQFLGIL